MNKLFKYVTAFSLTGALLVGCGDQDPVEEDEKTDDVIDEQQDVEEEKQDVKEELNKEDSDFEDEGEN